MLKRWDVSLRPGPAKRPLVQWKRDPHSIDAVLMYAQRGTESVRPSIPTTLWGLGRSGGRVRAGAVGKAYFGFTDEELKEARSLCPQQHDRAVRPVRAVGVPSPAGLVLEVAFEGADRFDTPPLRHCMRFPRINDCAGTNRRREGGPTGDVGEAPATSVVRAFPSPLWGVG